jgi:CubicO group peptidase (beta-lactamase class C family)
MNIESIKSAFEENFTQRGEVGASVSVWKGDTETVKFGEGFQDLDKSVPWTSDTPVLVWSATKGLASGCLLHALEGCNLPLETRVAHVWPQFAKAGKQDITIRMLLEHQTGLCALDQPPPVNDTEAVLDALEKQAPVWQPGSTHGYHPRTFGFVVDGVLQKLTGSESLGHYWRRVFAEPLGLDFWIGVPEDVLHRVAPVFAPKGLMPKEDPFFTAFMTPGSLTSRSFASPKGLHSAGAMNTREARMASYPGFGGIGTASALARFYAMLACEGTANGTRYFKSETLSHLEQNHIQGADRVLCIETAFSCGFMKDPVDRETGVKIRRTFGPNREAFGHPGAGGSIAFADPKTGIGFAYVMNQMAPGVLPNERALCLISACYDDH